MADLSRYEEHARLRVFQRRIDEARATLASIRGKRLVVSTSWGKDSCVVLHLALCELGVPLTSLHLRSPYELPGGEHIESWFRSLGVATVDTPTKLDLAGYLAWLQEAGLGYQRMSINRGKAKKIGELTRWYAEHGIKARVSGVRAEESKARRINFRTRGLTYELTSGVVSCNPLAWWTPVDVWAYIASRALPYHRLYDCETHGMTRESLRNAGWLTIREPERAAWLRRHFPEQWRTLAAAFPSVRLI